VSYTIDPLKSHRELMTKHARAAAIRVVQAGISTKAAMDECPTPKPTKQAVSRFVGLYRQAGIEEMTPATPTAGPDGKPILPDEVADPRSFRSPKTRFVTLAGILVSKGMPARTAAKEAVRVALAYGFDITMSQSTARRAGKTPGVEPKPVGAPPALPADYEEGLADVVDLFRGMKWPIFKSSLLAITNLFLANRPDLHSASAFPRGIASDRWYYAFLTRQGLTAKAQRPIEISRQKWWSSKNMGAHFDIVRDLALSLEGPNGEAFAIKNAAFDPKKPYDEEIFWTDYGRAHLVSSDETDGSLKTERRQSKADRVIVRKKGQPGAAFTGGTGAKKRKKADDGTTITPKHGKHGTIVAGSRGDGQRLPFLFIQASGFVCADHYKEAPRSSVIKNGERVASSFTCNNKGGMKNRLGVVHLEKCILRGLPEDVKKGAGGAPYIEIGDGHASHWTREKCQVTTEYHGKLVLRPPHTTGKCQGEDLSGFPAFKSKYSIQKQTMLVQKMLAGKGNELDWCDWMQCVRGPLEYAFSPEKCLQGWRAGGYIPFTRKPQWDALAEEQARNTVVATAEEKTGLGGLKDACRTFYGPTTSMEVDAPLLGGGAAGSGAGAGAGAGSGAGASPRDNCRAALVQAPRLTSAHLWAFGAVNEGEARKLIDAQSKKKQKRAQEAQKKTDARVAKSQGRLEEASANAQPLIVDLKSGKRAVPTLKGAECDALIRFKGGTPRGKVATKQAEVARLYAGILPRPVRRGRTAGEYIHS
jgi:hypothetical protein